MDIDRAHGRSVTDLPTVADVPTRAALPTVAGIPAASTVSRQRVGRIRRRNSLHPDVRDDDGQAAALIVGLVGVLAVIVVAIGLFGVHVRDLACARTAADAAALAGAARGSEAASQAAQDNGGHLDSFTSIGSDVIVRVTVGTASAIARAAIGHPSLPTLAVNGENRHSG